MKQLPALFVRHMSLVLGVLALLSLFGMQVRPASAESPAFVRIVHAAPDIGTADVFLDGVKVLSNFQFGTVTDYVNIPSGPHKVQVALIGKGAGAALITQTLSVNPGLAYTVAALGTQSMGFSLEVFIDDNHISTGLAKVRFYHLSPGVGALNVSAGGKTVISGLAYQQASDYLILPASSYRFNVTITQPNTTIPVSATLKANTVTSIFAVGVFNGTPKIEFVSAQVPALPAVPPTGSDPNATAAPENAQSLTPWLFAVLVLIVMGAGVATRHLAIVAQRAKVRS